MLLKALPIIYIMSTQPISAGNPWLGLLHCFPLPVTHHQGPRALGDQSEHGWADLAGAPLQLGIGSGQISSSSSQSSHSAFGSVSGSVLEIVDEAVQAFMKISQSQYPPASAS